MRKKSQNTNGPETIPFKFHPRVFAALGAKLVTSDVVAVLEIVKNSYDAYATEVEIQFACDEDQSVYLEIRDNGTGMDKAIINDVWTVVATDYREKHKKATKGRRVRRVSGKKGLGRLSIARLGNYMEMFTQTKKDTCWHVAVNWKDINQSTDIDLCSVEIEEYNGEPLFHKSGTIVRISDLHHPWDDDSDETADKITELRIGLLRFLPPFKDIDDFQVLFSSPATMTEPVIIDSSDFIAVPPYSLEGQVTSTGIFEGTYKGQWSQQPREKQLLWDLIKNVETKRPEPERAKSSCGAFSIEFRVWDLDKNSMMRIDERFNLGSKWRIIRETITEHPFNGISLYRDDVLVLPKSTTKGSGNKDWLELDLRRISRLGTRISSNQFIGVIYTTSEDNPLLEDTSDRERLSDNPSSQQLQAMVFNLIQLLEYERTADKRIPEEKEPPFADLLNDLRADELRDEIERLANRQAPYPEFVSTTEKYSNKVERAVSNIEKRLVYYSRLASLGTLAAFLQHETGNHTACKWRSKSVPSGGRKVYHLGTKLAL